MARRELNPAELLAEQLLDLVGCSIDDAIEVTVTAGYPTTAVTVTTLVRGKGPRRTETHVYQVGKRGVVR